MKADRLVDLIVAAMADLESVRDELRALDAAIGDGDLGITVADGARAVGAALAGPDIPRDPAGVLRLVARTFAATNPSTMSALAAGALLAAARGLGDSEDLDREQALGIVDTAAASIADRGGAQIGDKTILDALVPSAGALRAATGDDADALSAMIGAARRGVERTAGLRSARGRAAWVGDRSIGQLDGGATAYVRLLESLQSSWPRP